MPETYSYRVRFSQTYGTLAPLESIYLWDWPFGLSATEALCVLMEQYKDSVRPRLQTEDIALVYFANRRYGKDERMILCSDVGENGWTYHGSFQFDGLDWQEWEG